MTAVSRTEGSQSRGPGKAHREVYLPQLGSSAIRVHVCVWLCDICGSDAAGFYLGFYRINKTTLFVTMYSKKDEEESIKIPQ